MKSKCWLPLALGLVAIWGITLGSAQEVKHGVVVTERLVSTILRDNRVGLSPDRNIKVYLPPGYNESKRSYPVVYYCHNCFWSPEQAFADGNLVKLLEQGFTDKVVKEFILVMADYTSSTTGSLYENSSTSGRWLDYTVDEVVPFIDQRFRTLRHRDSRAVAGDFMGGRGALKLAMTHADLFSVVYALHPVATGTGSLPVTSLEVDWKKLHEAKTFADVAGMGRTPIFFAICQAFLPNPERPPLYCDFFVELENNELKLHPGNTRKAQAGFHLDETLDACAANLRSLRGLAFDWGRFDSTPAHVQSNQAFAQKLANLGIDHEAEEYSGDPWNKTWIKNGRFAARVLPFLARHLVFQE